MDEQDLWATDTGLVSNYEGEVVDSWFAVDPNLQESPTFLFLKMKTDNEDHPEITERYNCGPDWRSYDGGETVTHPTKKVFNNRSQAGVLVDTCVGLAGDTLRGRGAPTVAKTWLNTRWYMEAVSKPYKLRDGTSGTSTRNYPARWLGEGTESPPVGSKPVDSPIMRIVQDLAKTLPHREWVDRVLDVDGVMGDDDLVKRLADDTDTGLYQTLRRTS